MLSDARSLWFTASNAIATLNDNITTALENFELEAIQREKNVLEKETDNVHDLQRDLDMYKKLLDDAQMQHFELSKQSRMLVAEKEAELIYWRGRCESTTETSVKDEDVNSSSNIQIHRLVQEKLALEKTLEEVESNLANSLQERNAFHVMKKNYDELLNRFSAIKEDLSSCKIDSELKDKQKSETIENLVAEYSLLAAEAELLSSQSTKRVNEVLQENEILATKMHALEHSITELADRSVSQSWPPNNQTAALSSASTDSANSTISPMPSNSNNFTLELKEARAKITNLQFDLKERDSEITKLKLEKGSNAAGLSRSDEALQLSAELLAAKEKNEKYLSELITFRQENDTVKRDLASLALNHKKGNEECERLKSLVDSTQAALKELSRKEESRVADDDSASTTYAAEISHMNEMIASQKQTIDLLTSSLSDTKSQLSNQAAEVTRLESALTISEANAVALQEKIQAERVDFGKRLEASLGEEKMAATQQLLTKENELKKALALSETQILELKAALSTSEVAHVNALKQHQQADEAKLRAEIQKMEVGTERARSELIDSMNTNAQHELNQKLAALQQELLQSAEERERVLAEKWKGQQSEALESMRKENEILRLQSMQQLQADCDAERSLALSKLALSKDEDRAKALEELSCQKAQELELALREAQKNTAEQLTALQKTCDDKLSDMRKEVAQMQSDLTNVEARFKKITADALADLGARKDAEKSVELAALKADMQKIIDAVSAERDENLSNYTKERKLRKKLHNQLIDIQGNIRVICRVRPVLEVERRSGQDIDVTEIPPNTEDELYIQRDPHEKKTKYEYDRVFAPGSTQEEVFEAVQPLCVSVLDGFNVCIFAYGQTGSGKTFTMEGYGSDIGVSPRAISELLKQVSALEVSWTFTLTLSMLEIYNETILDLLCSNPGGSGKLDVRQTAEGNQVVGLSEIPIRSMEQVKELMKQGQANRAVGSHDMNEHSSRSHSIITIVCRGRNKIDNSVTYGKLHLIDLAGSERVGKTDATGDRLKEAQNINKSLSALGDVINALGNKKTTHVPYRNSKLTFLLQDSLGGNSKVLTFVNISPAIYNLGETICSLNFATRCRSTELGQAKKQAAVGSAATSSALGEDLSKPRRSALSSTAGGSAASLSALSEGLASTGPSPPSSSNGGGPLATAAKRVSVIPTTAAVKKLYKDCHYGESTDAPSTANSCCRNVCDGIDFENE